MKRIVTEEFGKEPSFVYESIFGRRYTDLAQAIADEDRLPKVIEVYMKDLEKMKAGEKVGFHDTKPEDIETYELAVKDYKAKWEQVQAERKAGWLVL